MHDKVNLEKWLRNKNNYDFIFLKLEINIKKKILWKILKI